MKNKRLSDTVLTAMFICLGIVLPFLTGQMREIGKMLLPMHIPILLCGLIAGWKYGILAGFITPLLRSLLFGMPHMYPNAAAMAFELAAYGFASGFLYSHFKIMSVKTVYISLIAAMIFGRIVWGISEVLLLGIGSGGFTFSAFIGGAFLNAVPGIILQLVLIPAVMALLNRKNK